MKRRIHALMLIAAIGTLAAVGIARAALVNNQYQGHVEKTPSSYFGFDVKKNGAVKRVKNVGAYLPYHCTGQPGTQWLYGPAKGSLRVKRGGVFAGTLRVDQFVGRGATATGTYEITGKLRKGGKARGRVRGEIVITPTPGGPGTSSHCYTGGLDWKTTKVTMTTRPPAA